MKFYCAQVETASFTFEGFGRTKAEAKRALLTGLKAHAKEHRLAPTGWYYANEISTREIKLGAAYRDRTQLVSEVSSKNVSKKGTKASR